MPTRRRGSFRGIAALLFGLLAAAVVLAAAPMSAFGDTGLGYQKYYGVAAAYQGKPENLSEISQRFLGTSGRSQEILQLNAGRRQPDGGALANPNELRPGWYLVLPWDAYGQGVVYGLLPAGVAATSPLAATQIQPPVAPTSLPKKSAAPHQPKAPRTGRGPCAAAKAADEHSQWAVLRVAPEHAWDHSRGSGVMVAVVDSGVDASLPGLSGRVSVGSDIVSGTGRGDTDCLGSGTAMASIIVAHADAGSVVGMAPDATVLPVRLTTTKPQARPSDQAAAIQFAVAAGVKVIALGGSVSDRDAAVAAAIRDATAQDVVVVAPAGATSVPATSPSGATAGGVLRVGAIGINGKPARLYSPGSLDVFAPGVAVAALGINGAGQVQVSGDQYAAAFAAGEAALIRARFPQLSAAQVNHRIAKTTVALSGGDASGWPGLIDPGQSVTRVLPEENRSPALRPDPGPDTPHPFRTQALIMVALLALLTVVLLILRARRIIRPDIPVAAPAVVPAGTGTVEVGAPLALPLPPEVEQAVAVEGARRETTVPVASVLVLDAPDGKSAGAERAEGGSRGTRRTAVRAEASDEHR